MKDNVRTVIIGTGVTGLCTSYYLAEAYGQDQILLLESSDFIGGQTGTDHTDGFSCDWGPNGFLDREPATLKWADDLGLTDKLMRANKLAERRFIMKNGQLQEIPMSPPKFLASPMLSIRGRLRLCCEPLIAGKKDDTPETIWNFAARRIGKEAADMLVGPMVTGVFGGDAHKLSLRHCFPRMDAMEKQYGSLFKAMLAKKKGKKKVSAAGPSGILTSFEDGIGYLPKIVGKKLGDRIKLNTPVTKIESKSDGFIIKTETGFEVESESVVVAIPTYKASEMVNGFGDKLSKALNDIPYADIAVLCTGYNLEKVYSDTNGFGFLVPRHEGRRVLGSIWTSSIFPNRAPKGWLQLRTMYGGFTDPDAVGLSDKEILDYLKKEVEDLMKIEGGPEFVKIYRWKRGIPQYTLDHQEKLDAIEAAEKSNPGLVFAGNAYRGVGLNDCVNSALRAVSLLTEE